MKCSRFSWGIAGLALILALFALFFDNIPAALAGCALAMFLIARAFLFLSAFSSSVKSLKAQRLLSTLFARQGYPVSVKTDVEVNIPPGFTAEISDLPPEGAFLSPGYSTGPLKNSISGTMTYSLALHSTGAHEFEGIRFCFFDGFFSAELVCKRQGTTAPALVILPQPEYPFPIESSYSQKDMSPIPVLTSPELRSFRKFVPGDDLRKIDWKLSAKNNSLIIREYMGRADQGPLLIIDLPDARHPFSPSAFQRLKQEAVSVIATYSHSRNEISILLICGPNLISFTQSEANASQLVEMITAISPTPRLHSLYRYSSTASLKRRYSRCSCPADPFSEKVIRISDAFLARRPPNVFEVQMARLFNSISASTAHFFTLDVGDASHIRIISTLAAIKGVTIQFHIPTENDDRVPKRGFGQSLTVLQVMELIR